MHSLAHINPSICLRVPCNPIIYVVMILISLANLVILYALTIITKEHVIIITIIIKGRYIMKRFPVSWQLWIHLSRISKLFGEVFIQGVIYLREIYIFQDWESKSNVQHAYLIPRVPDRILRGNSGSTISRSCRSCYFLTKIEARVLYGTDGLPSFTKRGPQWIIGRQIVIFYRWNVTFKIDLMLLSKYLYFTHLAL